MEPEILRRTLQPGAGCPEIDVLGRYADGGLSPAERAAAASHIERCATCQSELALLQAFAEGAIAENERAAVRDIVAQLRRREPEILTPPAVPERRRSPVMLVGSFRRALSLATLLVAVVGGYFMFTATPPRLPSGAVSDGGVTRSLAVELRTPVGDQVAAPQRLEWRPVPGAVRYRVRLMEVDRRELWSTETAEAAADLPGPVRALIVPAKTLLWQVTALNASNRSIGESSPERFRLSPP